MALAIQGNSQEVFLPTGQALTVTANAASNGNVWRLANTVGGDSSGVVAVSAGTSVTIGPFGHMTRHRIDVSVGSLTFVMAVPEVPLTPGYTVATLPAASTALKGARAFVTDADAPTFLGTLTGGGSVVCPVFCDGVAWVPG